MSKQTFVGNIMCTILLINKKNRTLKYKLKFLWNWGFVTIVSSRT